MPHRTIIVSPQGGGTPPTPPPPSTIQYPRISNVSQANQMAPNGASAAANITYGGLLDLCVISDQGEGGAAGNGYSRGAVVSAIQAGPIGTKVQQYGLVSYFVPPSGQQGSIWGNQILPMGNYWFLYTPPSGHTLTDDPGGPWATNPVDQGGAGRDSNGNALMGAWAKYQRDLYIAGSLPGQSSNDVAVTLNGMWLDNFTASGWYNQTGGNWLGGGPSGGTIYNNNDIAAMGPARTGMAQYVAWFRANAPAQFVMGNINVIGDQSDAPGVYIWRRPYSVIGPLYQLLDAGMGENAFGGQGPPNFVNSIEHFLGFEGVRQFIAYLDGMVLHPEFNQYGNYNQNATGNDGDFPNGSSGSGTGGANGTPGQAARYVICAILCVGNGCHDPLSSAAVGGLINTSGGWYDYYSVNPNTLVAVDYQTQQSSLGAGRKWLNVPIDPIQTAPTQGKCYARRFGMLNGRTALVLVNPSSNNNPGAAAQTINLTAAFGGTWSKITASAGNNDTNSTINSGATGLGSITIPVGDGIILVQ